MKKTWKRLWVKLWIELLDDPKMGQIPDWLWRRAIELFLLAGENENDGLLQPVMDMAWRLRTSETKLTESLAALSQVGVVHETPEGWLVVNFKKRQYSESLERMRRYRKRNGYGDSDGSGDGAVTEDDSTSISNSFSVSLEEDRGVGEGETKPPPNAAEAEFSGHFGRIGAMRHRSGNFEPGGLRSSPGRGIL